MLAHGYIICTPWHRSGPPKIIIGEMRALDRVSTHTGVQKRIFTTRVRLEF